MLRRACQSALWIIVASISVYLVAYRYYSLYIATKVMKLNRCGQHRGHQ
ncbi:carbon starvation CstA family protein [Shigella flexneri]